MLTPAVGQVSKLLSSLRGSSKLIRMSAKMSTTGFETLSVSVPQEYVYHVELNRPLKFNAINDTMLQEITKCFNELNIEKDCRAVVVSGAGKFFNAGLDLADAMSLGTELAEHEDVSRKAQLLLRRIQKFQKAMSSLEKCQKPVLAAIHSGCIGAGVDLITAADMRYCTKDAWFQVKEVDIGMAADVGTLQRLPKVLGSQSLARELCFTARKIAADEALSSGLVSRVFEDKESMITGVIEVANTISQKSPVAVQSTKLSLIYSRDHTVQEGLDQIATLNQLQLQSEDFINATVAQATKQKNVIFAKL